MFLVSLFSCIYLERNLRFKNDLSRDCHSEKSSILSFQLEASFAANVSAIEANCERVESRMNALLEKFESKGR